jgi:hypothetical protein
VIWRPEALEAACELPDGIALTFHSVPQALTDRRALY